MNTFQNSMQGTSLDCLDLVAKGADIPWKYTIEKTVLDRSKF